MEGLRLLAPTGLFALGLLAPLVLLYVLKVRRKRALVSSAWLWGLRADDTLARSPFRRLIAQTSLLLQILALVLLALAASRPATLGEEAQSSHVALVLDVSASMQARGRDGRATFELAKAEALAVLDGLPPGARAMVVEAGAEARVLTPLESDRTRVRAAIEQLSSHDTEGDLTAGVALAVDRLSSLTGAKVIAITDGHLASPLALEAPAVPVEVVRVGERVDNVAIVRADLRVASLSGGREEAEALVSVTNFGAAQREVFVTTRRLGSSDVLDARRLLLAPGEKAPVALRFDVARADYGELVSFELSPGDALTVDDRAALAIPRGRRLGVRLAGRSGPGLAWLERALAADEQIVLVEGGPGETGDDEDLLVSFGECPPESHQGDALVVAPPPGTCLGVRVGELVESPVVTSFEGPDPRMRFVDLGDVRLARGSLLSPPSPSMALVRAGPGALVVDASTTSRAVTMLGFDPGESTWPLKASFVLFVRNVAELTRARRAAAVAPSARAGEPITLIAPRGAVTVAATDPRGGAVDATLRDGVAVLPPARVAGVYRVTFDAQEAGARSVPVNLTSARESDLDRADDVPSLAGVVGRAAREAPRGHRELGWGLALVALAIVVLEVCWFLSRSRGGARAPARRPRPALLVGLLLSLALVGYALATRRGWVQPTWARLSRPSLVFVAPLALGLLSWAARRFTRRGARAHVEEALIAVVALSLSLATIGVEIGRTLDKMTVIFVIDRSRSIDLVPGGADLAVRELPLAEQHMRDGDRVAVVAVGAGAVTEQPPRSRSEPPLSQAAVVARDATNLEQGLRRALAEVPPDTAARIVLVSDGVATRGDVMDAASAAVAAQIPVDTLVLTQRSVADVRVASVTMAPRADAGETVELRVVTSSTHEAEVEVRVRVDGKLARTGTARIAAGEDVIVLREKVPDAGLRRYDVEVTALDASLDATPDDNARSSFVRVRGKAVALLLEGDRGAGAFVAAALAQAEILVEERSVAAFPADLAALAAYDLVVLSDVPAAALSPAQIASLGAYVRDLGGGLVLLGGDRGMGPGGYGHTAVEEVSPVSFDLKQEERRASLAEVIAIDTSGSMGAKVGGLTKLELANEAAVRAARLLGPADRLGVLHVDTEVHRTVPLGALGNMASLDKAIRSMPVGGGGIIVPIALEDAYGALDKDPTSLRHVLLLSDGDDAEDIERALSLAADAKGRGITTTAIALGRGKDLTALEELTKQGGGRYYLIEDASRLPAVFAQETILATRSALVEEPFRAVPMTPGPPTVGIDFSAAPELAGYVVTLPKPRATVHLAALDGDPLLATWSVGLGRAAVFTSDLKDRWGSAWTAWAPSARLIAQLARDVARRPEDDRVRLEARATGGKLEVRATAVRRGRGDPLRALRATIAGPGGTSREVELEPTSVGTYEASVPLDRAGAYVVVGHDAATGQAIGTSAAVHSAGDELRPTGSDPALLARLSAFTGGVTRTSLELVFRDRAAARRAYDDITARIAMLAALLLLTAVAARKLGMPEVLARARERLATRLREPAPMQPARATSATVGSLLTVKRAGNLAGRARTPDPAAEPRPPAVAGLPTPPPPGPRPAGASPGRLVPRAAPPDRPPPPEGPAAPPPDPGARPRSTAELLVARRKAKK